MVKWVFISLSLYWNSIAQDFSKQFEYAASKYHTESIEKLSDLWDYYSDNPIDLNNSIDLEQLSLLNLISEVECKRIQAYCQNRKLVSIYELQGINIEIEALKRIKKFIRVSEKKGQSLRIKKNVFYTSIKRQIQDNHGHTNKTYVGSRFKSHIRFRMQMKNGWDIGINCEKDAGEPFWYKNDGVNNLGGYIAFKNAQKRYKIILGKYDLNLGEGLLFGTSYRINNPYFLSYSPLFTVKETLSSKEHRYFQGGSVQWAYNRLNLGLFTSIRKLPVNPESGLHRSVSEIQRRKKIKEHILGLWINRKIKQGKISWSGVYYESMKNNQEYHLLQSLFFSKNYFNINYSGEITSQNFQLWATLQKLTFSISSNSLLSLQYRNRDYGFLNAFRADYSSFSNGYERGFLYSFQYIFNEKWHLNATFDQYYPNYNKQEYSVILPSEKKSVEISRVTSLRKVIVKLQKKTNTKTINKLYINYQEKLSPALVLHMTGECIDNSELKNTNLNFKMNWTNTKKKSKSCFSYGIFNTRNQTMYWKSPYVLGIYNSRFINGSGSIYSATYQRKWSKSIKYGAQLMQIGYSDRNHIGSGNERINGSSRTEFSIYLKWSSN